jgi:signal transduction histidine kinase
MMSATSRMDSEAGFINRVLSVLVEFSKIDSVELWLEDAGVYSHHAFAADRPDELICEKFSIVNDRRIDCVLDSGGAIVSKSFCPWLLHPFMDRKGGNFTANDSFWTGDLERPVELRDKNGELSQMWLDEPSRRKGSFAIIPIIAGDSRLGYLCLMSSKKDAFNIGIIELFEDVAQTIGAALLSKRAQIALGERVKELTCLYGIAKLQDEYSSTSAPLKVILSDMVKLLPPAWQFPELAAARISLDDISATTHGFAESPYVQKADITINFERKGSVEVVYSAEECVFNDWPFLKEEESLIQAVARQISLFVERKLAAEEKQKLQDQLRHADRLATIGQLSAGVAHELNEPIGNILGFAQLARKSLAISQGFAPGEKSVPGERPASAKGTALPTQVVHDLDKIVNASLHAREIIRKLMLFSRQATSKKDLVDVNRVVEDGLYFLESRCAKAGIEIVKELSAHPVEVVADEGQLHQVLVNLVVNAIQAMPEGGRLTVRTFERGESGARDKSLNDGEPLTMGESSTCACVVSMVVEDTGIGMSEHVRSQIFLPFFTTKDVGQGTGLGLAVVHGIVTSHNGKIAVESKSGKGSRFTITLPSARTIEKEEHPDEHKTN